MLRREVLQFLGSLPFINLLSSNKDESVVREGIVGDPDIEYNNIYIDSNLKNDYYHMTIEDNHRIAIPVYKELSLNDVKTLETEFKKSHKNGYAYLIWKSENRKSGPSPVYLVGICFHTKKLTPYSLTFLELE